MEQKLLFAASTSMHICQFHLPYLRQLREEGWTVHAACGYETREIPHAHRIIPLPLKKSLLSLKNLQAARDLRRLIRQEGYAAILVHTSLAAFFTRLALLGLKEHPRVINMVHGYLFDDETNLLKRKLLLLAERITAPVTDLVITMNEYDYALATTHRLGKRIVTVPGVGVDFPRLDGQKTGHPELLREKLGIPQDAFVLLYAAEFSRRKNQQEMLKTLALLPEQVVLILPGMGQEHIACWRLAEKLGISHRVWFPGFLEEMGPWYEMADGVVSSSRSEGLPFHVMEAMHFALPVVASRIKGHRDLIEDGVSGLLYDHGDSRGCARQIEKLLHDPELSRSLGQAAKEKAGQYALEQVFPRIMELYRQVLSPSGE